MSGLVKNQIAKQLARFTKNLSPNKISLKFLKGEGELHNLELNEKILTDLLELPPWLRLTKAVCNKISAKIHWTKLKTDPICLYLDCVEVNMEAVTDTCQKAAPQLPTQQPTQNPAKERPPTKYGFVEKVVDGMYVQINSVIVSFKSTSFLATVNMSRLVIRSTSHEWEPADLRMTRIKDDLKGQVLTFKQITWSTLRIDANALYDHKTCYQTSSPLRLITSHSSLNITIKKSTEDCSVLSARLELLLDDILWVLNQTQLQALAGFLNSIGDVFNRTGSGQEPGANPAPAGQAAQPQTQYIRSNVQTGTEKPSYHPLFKQYDVVETSYHLRTGRIDLHLCDDSSLTYQAKKQTVEDSNGGAMQIQINKLSLDHYPYHLAGTSRTGWVCHNEASLQRAYWVNQLLNTFRTCLRNKGKHSHSHPVTSGTCGTAGGSYPCGSDGSSRRTYPQSHSVPASPRQAPKTSHPTTNQQQCQVAHSLSNPQKRPVFMYESCFMIRCEEFSIQPVMMSNSSGATVPFLSSDKKALFLPSDMPAFQLDYTQYYYPAGIKSTVPAPNLFVQLNPVQLTLDPATCVWFNRFMHSIVSRASWAEDLAQQSLEQQPSHIDIRIEALMPKVNIPCPSDPNAYYKESRPQALQLQMSQVFVTNSRIGANSTQSDLLMFLQEFQASKLYADLSMFPNSPDDLHPLPNVAWVNDNSVVDEASVERNLSGIQENGQHSKQLSQVWCISAEQVWLDFIGVASANNRPVPFVDAIPLHMWICTPLPTTPTCSSPDTDMADGCAQPANRESVESDLSFSPDSPPNINRQPFSSKLPSHRKISEPLSPTSLHKARAGLEQYSFLHNSSSSPNLNQKSKSASGELLNYHPGLSGVMEICSGTQDRDCNSLPASPRRFLSRLNPGQMQEESQQDKKPLVASSTSVASTTSSSSLPSVPDSESSQEEFVMMDKELSEPPPVYEECSLGMNIPNGHCVRDVSQPLVFDEKPPPYEAPPHAREGPNNMSGLSKYQNYNGAPPRYSTVPQTMNGPNSVSGVQNGYTSQDPSEEAPPLPVKAPLPEATIQYFTGMTDDKSQILKSQGAQIADMTVLIAFHETVKVQLDHFQFVFLLRMQEMLTKLMEDIEKDRSKFDIKSAESPTAPEPAITCHLITKGAEVNIILPPTPEVNQTIGSCYGNSSTASSYQDTGIVSDLGSESPAVNGMSPDSLNTDDSKVSDLPEDSRDSPRYHEAHARNDAFTPVSFSHSDSVPVSDILSPRTDASGASGRASVASNVSSEAWMLGAESERSLRDDQSSRRNSEGSCASAGRESSLSVTDDSVKKAKKYKKASIVTVQGSDIQLGIQMKGLDMAVKVAVQKLDLSEAGNVNLDKFINRKSAKTTSTSQPTPIPQTDACTPMACVRAEFGPMARKYDPVAEERGFAHVKLCELVASLTISNAESLSDCFEDELLLPPMPFLVELRHSQVSVINDAPPRLLSAPPPIPINLGIQSITIRRNDDGSMNISGVQTDSNSDRGCIGSPATRQSSASASETSLTDGMISPKLDELENENHRLAEQLAVTQTAMRSVQEEREALLKTIDRLQMELAISNREQEQLQEKLLVLAYPRGSSPRKGHR